jgi:hypothetical protein
VEREKDLLGDPGVVLVPGATALLAPGRASAAQEDVRASDCDSGLYIVQYTGR